MITAEKPALNEDLLVHFGIKGMRWGVRKKQQYVTKDERLRQVNKQLQKESWRAGNTSSVAAKTIRGASAAGAVLLVGHLAVGALVSPRRLVLNRVTAGILTGAAGYVLASEIGHARAVTRVKNLSQERAELIRDGAKG